MLNLSELRLELRAPPRSYFPKDIERMNERNWLSQSNMSYKLHRKKKNTRRFALINHKVLIRIFFVCSFQ